MIYLSLFVFLTVASQVILKFESNKTASNKTGKYLVNMFINYRVLIAYFISFINIIIWIFALKNISLFTAIVFTSLTYLFMLIADNVFFNQIINTNKILGVVFIIIGVLLTV